MKHNKTGTIFMVSILALAGIGISYAGFSDSISIYGTVDTATVEIDWIGWYSGTWVYKIYDFESPPGTPPGTPVVYELTDEILIYRGFTQLQPLPAAVEAWALANGGIAELVSYSEAKVGTTPLPSGPGTYDIDMVYDNLFPCIDFTADFIFHYEGTIPAVIDTAQIYPLDEDPYPGPGDGGFLTYLWAFHKIPGNEAYGAWVEAYRAYPIYTNPSDPTSPIIGWTIHPDEPVDVGYQLHACNYVYVKLTIHLPQDNNLQGLSGTFGGKIGVIQWNDACGIT